MEGKEMPDEKDPFMEYQRAWALFGPGSDIKPMLPMPGVPTLPSITPKDTEPDSEDDNQ